MEPERLRGKGLCEEPSLQIPAKDQDGRGLLELGREAIPQHGTLAGESSTTTGSS